MVAPDNFASWIIMGLAGHGPAALVLDGMNIFGPIGYGQTHNATCTLTALENVGVHFLLSQWFPSWEECSQLLSLKSFLRKSSLDNGFPPSYSLHPFQLN